MQCASIYVSDLPEPQVLLWADRNLCTSFPRALHVLLVIIHADKVLGFRADNACIKIQRIERPVCVCACVTLQSDDFKSFPLGWGSPALRGLWTSWVQLELLTRVPLVQGPRSRVYTLTLTSLIRSKWVLNVFLFVLTVCRHIRATKQITLDKSPN